MTILDVVRISFTNLTGNRMRSLLTIMGIGVGIATIVFLVSLGYGLQDLSVKRIASIEAVNTVNVSAGKAAVPDQAFIDRYKNDARIEKVVVVNTTPVQAKYEGKTIDAVASIVSADYFSLEGMKVEGGEFFTTSSEKSMVISTGFAKGLNLPLNELINKELPINFVVKKLSSNQPQVFQEQMKVTGVYLDDATAVSIVSPDILKKTGELPINQVKVKVTDRNVVSAVKNEIENNGFAVASVADTIGQLDTIFRIVQMVLAIFGGIALVVASIGMFNTMTIALMERTRDVGIMKATGTDDSRIYLIFLSEAVLISGTGGLIGLGIGWATQVLVNSAINYLAMSVGGEAVDLFSMPIVFISLILGFSLMVGISTGFLPARRASKLNPLEALRYE